MPDLIAIAVSVFIAVFGTVMFTGGWLLRGVRDQHRAEVARDNAWDEAAGADGQA